MTTRVNPFANEPEKAEAFEAGYVAGFQDPAGDHDDFLPLAPELLEIRVAGADAGRADAHEPPQSGMQWVSRAELDEHAESVDEMKEHIATFVIFKALEIVTRKALLGLVDLVITAVSIEGNTSPEQFRTLEDDFELPASDAAADNVVYVPACGRTDHAMSTTSADGRWMGAPCQTLEEALQICLQHGHPEAYIARCDLDAKTCGAVWLAKDAN